MGLYATVAQGIPFWVIWADPKWGADTASLAKVTMLA